MKIAAIGANFPNRGGDGIRSPEGEPKASAIRRKTNRVCQAGNRNQFSGVRAISVGQENVRALGKCERWRGLPVGGGNTQTCASFSKNALSVTKSCE